LASLRSPPWFMLPFASVLCDCKNRTFLRNSAVPDGEVEVDETFRWRCCPIHARRQTPNGRITETGTKGQSCGHGNLGTWRRDSPRCGPSAIAKKACGCKLTFAPHVKAGSAIYTRCAQLSLSGTQGPRVSSTQVYRTTQKGTLTDKIHTNGPRKTSGACFKAPTGKGTYISR